MFETGPINKVCSPLTLIYIKIVYALVYILVYILKETRHFSIGQLLILLYTFQIQIKFDLKNINQEFLLILKSLNKHSIQYFTI